MASFFVGIDVSKDSSATHGLNKEGHKLFYIESPMNAEGFTELHEAIKSNRRTVQKPESAWTPKAVII